MPDESNEQRAINFTVRIVQEYEVTAATLEDAYAEMARLKQRGDDRATLVDSGAMMCPLTDADAALLAPEVPAS